MNKAEREIVFMGTSDFAVPALEALYEAGYGIPYVVTTPDRARGRGGKILPTPVGLFAEKNGLKLLKPESLKDDEGFKRALTEAEPDLIAVAAYGKILPEYLLRIPRFGCVNIHASLLPEYRGAAPVQRAILDGKSETGVTLMYMSKGLDTGDVIAAVNTNASGKNAGELTAELARLGAALLLKEMPALLDGTAPRLPQDGAKATYAEKVEKAEGVLRFDFAAEEIERRVRAMTPAPGAYIEKGGDRIGVTAAAAIGRKTAERVFEAYEKAACGTVLDVSNQGIAVRAGEGAVLIEAIKMPGRKAMAVAEYLKGNDFDIKSF